VWWLCLLMLACAHGRPVGRVEFAEYNRLSEEIQRLAQKNAWTGVERAYQSALDTGVQLSFEDNMVGAQAARQMGNVLASRSRLVAALRLQPNDPIALAALTEIDLHFGRVALYGERTHLLVPEEASFNPDYVAAVAFASASIEATGVFEGLLPAGRYRFGEFEVRVDQSQTLTMDLRPVRRKP
jgi:hypothetical protein